jgi:hypothetical protein
VAIKYDYTGPASTIAKVKFPVNVTDEFAGVRERLGAALTSKETRFSKNYRKQLAQLTVLSQRGTGGNSSPKGDVHESGRGKGGEHRGDDPGVAEVGFNGSNSECDVARRLSQGKRNESQGHKDRERDHDYDYFMLRKNVMAKGERRFGLW